MPIPKSLKNIISSLDTKLTIGKGFLTGKLKFGTPTEYNVWHQSFSPIKEFKVPFPERWDAATHGADPNLIWFTNAKTPNTTGLMAERPFASQWSFTAQRPLIQTGEVKSVLGRKNNTRNAIVQFGKKHGADAFEFNGISDNRLPITNVVAISENITPEYVGGTAKIKYAGPTTGKTTFIKSNNDPQFVDLDAIEQYKAIRQKVANELGLDFRDPAVTDSKEYQTAFNDFIRRWSQDKENLGKTLFGSSKALLRGDAPLQGEPFIPKLSTFIERNRARGFKENEQQLINWYNSIIESRPNIRIDDRFISEIPLKSYEQPQTKYISLEPESNFMSLGPEWEGLESPYLTVYHRGLDGQQPYEHPKFKGVLGGAGYDSSLDDWFNIKPEFKMTPNEARHFNLKKLADKYFGGDTHKALDYLNKNR